MPLLSCHFLSELLLSGRKPNVLFGQRNSKSCDCELKLNQEPLWINSWCKPHWAATERSPGEEEIDKDATQSFMALLKACAKKKDLQQGTRLHTNICNSGLLTTNTHLGNMVITMYAKCRALHKAQQVHHQLPHRDAVSWNALIAGYAQNEQGEEALHSYEQMLSESFSPDAITYSSILKACGITQNLDIGTQIHDKIASQGLLRGDIVLGSSLVDMYAKCNVLSKAKEVLEDLPVRDVISWNALIAGYSQQGKGEEALDCFERMQSEGLSPTAITYTCVLKACPLQVQLRGAKKFMMRLLDRDFWGKM